MSQTLNILITEANSRVREFLKRELSVEGFRIFTAENAEQMAARLYVTPTVDALIIDPDLPDMAAMSIMSDLNRQMPHLPVIFHTFPADFAQYVGIMGHAVFIEKQGSSVERLKQVLWDIRDRKVMKEKIT